ncbi:MAG: ABC transporter permease [Saprospiraceae bacterium]|nr:ABC transporter permease [Saprospiraceae bacterium]
MFKHNLLLAFRHFLRFKGSFFINQLGLSVGLATTFLVALWVYEEWQVDKFHALDDQLYRMVSDSHSKETLLNTSSLVTKQLAEEIPEIEAIVNSSWGAISSSLSTEKEQVGAVGEFASAPFFQFFSYPLLQGKAENVLEKPASIVLSEEMAKQLFGTTEVVGEILRWQWYSMQNEVTVTGVFTLPRQSSMQFDYVLSFDVFEEHFGARIERGQHNARTYVKVQQQADIPALNRKIDALIREKYPESTWSPFLIPYSSFYLQNSYKNRKATGGRIVYVRLFSIISVLILLIACINFMNLSTARASRRMKEMGIKKAVGASRMALVYQHLVESILQSFLAGFLAIGLVFLILPYFGQMMGKTLALQMSPTLLLALVAILLLTGLISGSYPALYLSAFKPKEILQGSLKAAFGETWLRKGLVIFQFGISMILILAVWTVHQQMLFLQNKDLGYEKQQILTFSTNGFTVEKQNEFISRVRNFPGVLAASSISHALVGMQASTAEVQWEGKDPASQIWFEHGRVDYGMLEMLDIELQDGRFFSAERGDEISKVIINEKAQELMGLEEAVGKIIRVGENPLEIIGVTRDFHFESLHELVKPTFFRWSNRRALRIAVKIESSNEQQTLARIEDLHKGFDTGYPFQFTFLNEDYQQKYVAEQKVVMLSRFAATLAIFISCLGLLGLSSFMAEKRTKEIGVRKVLGASSHQIVYLLTIDFCKLVLVAILMAAPIGYLLADNWLATFAYHIKVDPLSIAWAGLLLLLIAWLTVSVQTMKTAQVNPVECISE